MKDKFINSYRMVSSHEGTLFIYAFAYALIIGVAPFLIITVLVTSTLLLDMNAMVNLLAHYIPTDLIEPFVLYVKQIAPSDLILLISLSSVSFWVASKSVYSFLLEASRVDRVHIQAFILRIVSVIYFMVIVLGAIGFFVLFRFLPPYNFITVPIILWLMMMSFYRLVSFKFSSFSDVYMGSAIATAGLIFLGRLFFVYVNNFSNYQNIYGPMASLMILLISIYYISYIIYFGFCVNVVFYEANDEESIKEKLVYKLSHLRIMSFFENKK